MGRLPLLIFALLPLLAQANWLNELPKRGNRLPGFGSVDSVAATLAALPLTPAEGVWQMVGDGAIFAIVRHESERTESLPRRYLMVMVSGPERRVRPGTLIGHLVPTVRPGVYEARIYNKVAEFGGLELPRRFLVTVNPKLNTLTLEPYKWPLKVNVLNFLPYMYRYVVRPQKSRPDGLDGAVRVYPPSNTGLTPVYL